MNKLLYTTCHRCWRWYIGAAICQRLEVCSWTQCPAAPNAHQNESISQPHQTPVTKQFVFGIGLPYARHYIHIWACLYMGMPLYGHAFIWAWLYIFQEIREGNERSSGWRLDEFIHNANNNGKRTDLDVAPVCKCNSTVEQGSGSQT